MVGAKRQAEEFARPTPSLVDELRRYARGESYDEQPMADLDSEAIDFRAASESFAPVRKLKRGDLETLRLLGLIPLSNLPFIPS